MTRLSLKQFQSKGGKARAKALTKEQLSEIGKKGVKIREQNKLKKSNPQKDSDLLAS